MLFPTVEFAVFFFVVLALTWLLADRNEAKKLMLLVASYIFYGFWNWLYIPLLFGISAISFIIARGIQLSSSEKTNKKLLVCGVIICLSILFYYKYIVFFALSLQDVLSAFNIHPVWNISTPMLPLGVSFFVFHAISLMGDSYRGKVKIKIRFFDSLLYVAFFPQLIAGPILRASTFLPQLAKRSDPQVIRMNLALMLVCAGLFKKVVISNILATRLVDPVFASPESYSAADTLLAVYGYAAQIYCDFSGYTSIAAGCAIMLGYSFPRNFNAPYCAVDPQDFWRRWHISLSTWLRDYLYIPLGGSKCSQPRTYLNLFITMVLGGLWHGANWTFVIWGMLHGLYLVIHRYWSSIDLPSLKSFRSSSWWRWVSRILLFNAVCIGWVFFRAPSFDVAFAVFQSMTVPGLATLATAPVIIVLLLGLFMQYRPRRWDMALERELSHWPLLVRGVALAIVIFLIEVLGPSGVAPFIYFQF